MAKKKKKKHLRGYKVVPRLVLWIPWLAERAYSCILLVARQSKAGMTTRAAARPQINEQAIFIITAAHLCHIL